MKSLKIFFLSLLLITGFNSCDDSFITEDYNKDPNNPTDVSIKLLLPSSQVSWGYVVGGDFGRLVTIFTQHHTGVDRQHTAFDVYQFTESDVNNAWNGVYSTSLSDLKAVQTKATETKSPHYTGVAKIMEAFIVSTLVDLFNDIPYSQALKGAANLNPAYDKGADIYNALLTNLDAAIADLNATASVFSPSTDDLVYGGDKAKWKALANSLKARLYLHLSKKDASNYGKALAAIGAGSLGSNAMNANIPFGDNANEQNPYFQFDDQRNDCRMGKFFIDMLMSSNDPRLPIFALADAAGKYHGGAAGGTDIMANGWGSFYASASSPVPLMHYAEVKFIEAEAALGTDKVRAAKAYNDAVIASLASFGKSDATYEAANAAETDATITLAKIINQKYIALYSQLEPWSDWRRTGLPALTPAAGNQIARRFPYPQDERLFNLKNYIANVTVFDKVFWD